MDGGQALPGIHSPALRMAGTGFVPTGNDVSRSNTKGGLWFPNKLLLTEIAPDFNNAWMLTATTYNFNPAGVYLPVWVYGIDQKIDDGLPETGNVVAFSGNVTGFCQVTPMGANCKSPANVNTGGGYTDACINNSGVNAAKPIYNNTITAPSGTSLCSLLIRTPF